MKPEIWNTINSPKKITFFDLVVKSVTATPVKLPFIHRLVGVPQQFDFVVHVSLNSTKLKSGFCLTDNNGNKWTVEATDRTLCHLFMTKRAKKLDYIGFDELHIFHSSFQHVASLLGKTKVEKETTFNWAEPL